MKLFVVLSACVLLVIGQLDAVPFSKRPSESFAGLVANRTASMLERDENPSTLATLAYKSSSMFIAAHTLHIELPAQNLISDVTYTASRFMTPDRALADIQELQKVILRSLSYVDNERPADISAANNELIDNFVNEYTEKAAEEFEKMHGLSINATQEIEPLAQDLNQLIDELVAKIDSCLSIKSVDFRLVFQCNKDCHALENRITPGLADLRSAADKLYSDYWNVWNAFLSDFNAKLQEVQEQIWKPQYSPVA